MEIWKDSYKIQNGSCFWGVRDRIRLGRGGKGNVNFSGKAYFF